MVSTHTLNGSTRERIQSTALRFFVERGYEKTSLREIAEELGVTKAALYYHFRTKEDILVSLLETVGTALDELIAWGREQPRTPETKREIIRRYSEIFSDGAPLVRIMQQNHAALSDLSVGQDFSDRSSALAELLKEPDAPVEAQVRYVNALLTVHFGTFALQHIEGGEEEKREALLHCALDVLSSAHEHYSGDAQQS